MGPNLTDFLKVPLLRYCIAAMIMTVIKMIILEVMARVIMI